MQKVTTEQAIKNINKEIEEKAKEKGRELTEKDKVNII